MTNTKQITFSKQITITLSLDELSMLQRGLHAELDEMERFLEWARKTAAAKGKLDKLEKIEAMYAEKDVNYRRLLVKLEGIRCYSMVNLDELETA